MLDDQCSSVSPSPALDPMEVQSDVAQEYVMKALIVVLTWGFGCGTLMAEPPGQTPNQAAPEQDLGEVKVEQPIELEKAVAPEDAWSQGSSGVLGQFIQAPNVLAPINPLAKAEAGSGEDNLSTDTATGRVMGLHLIKFEF